MPIWTRLVEDLSDTNGVEVELASIPRVDEHVFAKGKLYLVKEVCHWDLLREQPNDRPLVVLQVDEVE